MPCCAACLFVTAKQPCWLLNKARKTITHCRSAHRPALYCAPRPAPPRPALCLSSALCPASSLLPQALRSARAYRATLTTSATSSPTVWSSTSCLSTWLTAATTASWESGSSHRWVGGGGGQAGKTLCRVHAGGWEATAQHGACWCSMGQHWAQRRVLCVRITHSTATHAPHTHTRVRKSPPKPANGHTHTLHTH